MPSPVELDDIKGLDVVGFMQPADEVGGDYYAVLDGVTRHIGTQKVYDDVTLVVLKLLE